MQTQTQDTPKETAAFQCQPERGNQPLSTTSSPEVSLQARLETLISDSKYDWQGFGERGVPYAGKVKPVPVLGEEYAPVIERMVARYQDGLVPMRHRPQDQQIFTRLMIGLSALFPLKDLGEAGFGLRQALLDRIFLDYPVSAIDEACVIYSRTGEWFPVPKHLIEIADKVIQQRMRKVANLMRLKEKMGGDGA